MQVSFIFLWTEPNWTISLRHWKGLIDKFLLSAIAFLIGMTCVLSSVPIETWTWCYYYIADVFTTFMSCVAAPKKSWKKKEIINYLSKGIHMSINIDSCNLVHYELIHLFPLKILLNSIPITYWIIKNAIYIPKRTLIFIYSICYIFVGRAVVWECFALETIQVVN